MRVHRLLLLCVVIPFLGSTLALAQSPESKPRILGKIDENQLVPLKGNVHPAAIAKNDLGPVQPNLSMNGLILVLSRSPEQQAAFDEFVASQYDATSPNYHHWLLPAEVGEKYGPSLDDIATVSNWLSSHGLAVSAVSKDRMAIHFNGSAAQVESAFHTEIHNLSVNGVRHIANMSNPEIPMALTPVVVGVKALHDFTPKPLHHGGAQVVRDAETGKWKRLVSEPTVADLAGFIGRSQANPETASGSGGNLEENISPYDFATIYNVLPLWNATTPINGTGQTIAITGTSDILLSDVASFRSAFGLPPGLTPIEVKGANGLDPGTCFAADGSGATCVIDDLDENTLDVEWSGAVAPGAQIVLVTSGQQSADDDVVYDSSDYVVENIGVSGSPVAAAHILNVSYGLCELFAGTAGNVVYNNLWQTAATEGLAVFVASGDSGAASCDQSVAPANGPYAAEYGLTVSGVASTPYNTAVGGTDLNWSSSPTTYWNTTNNSTTQASVKGYVPEQPWNDMCTEPAFDALVNSQGSTSYTATQICDGIDTGTIKGANASDETFFQDTVNVVGGSGGASGCVVNDAATSNNPTCSTGATSTGSSYGSLTLVNNGWPKPSWQAGVAGIPTDGVRDIPDVSFFAGNGFLGSAYLVSISTSSTSGPVLQEFGGTSFASPAMAGVMALINQKAGAPQGNPNASLYALAATQNYASCSSETSTVSNSCYFNDIDQGTISTPCDFKDSSPNCTGSDQVGILSGYSATVGFDQATGLGSMNVANTVNALAPNATAPATATVALVPTSASFPVSQAIMVAITVSGAGATPTGTITLIGGTYVGGAKTLTGGTATFSIPAYGLAEPTTSTVTLNAAYGGDANYQPASGTTTVTVTKLASSITATPSATSIAANAALTITGTVTGVAGSPAPTGNVGVSGGGYTSSSPALLGTGGTYTISIPASSLSVGADTLTVTYSGDANYSSSSNTAAVTVSAAAAATYSLSASATTAVAPGASTSSTITAKGSGGYAGNVTLSCALTTSPSGASDLPTCSVGTGNPIALSATTTSGTVSVSVTTTAATSGALVRPALRRNSEMILAGFGGAALALLALLGIPKQRRAFRSMLGMLALVLMLSGLAACGGGSGSSGGSGGGSGGGGTSNPGTTAGAYTFTVSGTGSDTAKTAASTTFTVTVN